jgi:hypothetical protein
LISARKEDQAFAAEVALGAELSFKYTESYPEGASIIANEDVAVILVDVSTEKQYQAFESSLQETVGLFSDKINSNAIHFLSSSDLAEVKYLIQSPLFGHFVMRNYNVPADAGKHYGRIIKATLSDRAFGISKYLKPGANIQAVKLKLSTQKQNAVEAIKNYLIAAKFPTRISTVIANAVDELLMNAIFDAPIDELGKPTLSSVPRNTLVKLEGPNAVEMNVGYDGQYVAISAVDSYGSLDKNKLLSHISKIYDKEEYKVRTAVAGAGIGLATVFRSGGSFFFVSESRVKTEVTVFFKKCDNYREFKDQFRFISTQFYF